MWRFRFETLRALAGKIRGSRSGVEPGKSRFSEAMQMTPILRDRATVGEIDVFRGIRGDCVHGGPCGAGAVDHNYDHADGTVDDPVGYARDGAGGSAGDPRAAQGRCRIHEFRRDRRGKGRGGARGPGVSDAARGAGCSEHVRVQLTGLREQPCVRSESRGHSEHDPRGGRPEDRSRRDGKQRGRSRGAGLSAHAEGHDCAGRECIRD